MRTKVLYLNPRIGRVLVLVLTDRTYSQCCISLSSEEQLSVIPKLAR